MKSYEIIYKRNSKIETITCSEFSLNIMKHNIEKMEGTILEIKERKQPKKEIEGELQ